MQTIWMAVGGVILVWLTLTVVLRWLARPARASSTLDRGKGRALVVLVHGLSGHKAMQTMAGLARDTFPEADLLTFMYDARVLANTDVFGVTNALETEIHAAFEERRHESIVLVGHSMGAMIARKALLWGHGLEDDRKAPKGKRPWVDQVVRIVSLAGINRGWSITPRPEKMGILRHLALRIGERACRLTGAGQMLLAIQRGAPFIADSRVQWIRLTRGHGAESAGDPGGATTRKLPQVIHLLGDHDDIVSHADATDLGVAKDTIFVTVANTNHRDIIAADAPQRRELLRHALRGDTDALDEDLAGGLKEEPGVRRVIYVMHGIRDYGGWTDRVRDGIQAHLAARDAVSPDVSSDVSSDASSAGSSSASPVAVVNKKYGYFPMLRFLLYWDRQRNVRRFMDEYTENVARYPNAADFDFVGHSNGTYILASALQRYRTIDIRRVYFAGSVVPKHYPWRTLLDDNRAQRVVNVVAAGDWVVALFPKLFEQIADWLNVQPTTGVLDLGAAGFRGFQAGEDPHGRLVNVEFVDGPHSAGVDTSNAKKLDAIVAYVVDGDESRLGVFRDATAPRGWLDVASNLSWLVCLLIALAAVAIGIGLSAAHPWAGIAYAIVLFGLLMSV